MAWSRRLRPLQDDALAVWTLSESVFAADDRVPGTGSCSNYAARGPVIQCVPYRLVASRSRRLSRAAAGPVTDPCLRAGHPRRERTLNLATSNRVVQPVM